MSSWSAIDEKYGRVVAYNVKQEWPLNKEDYSRRLRGDNRRLSTFESISELFLDVDFIQSDYKFDYDNLLPI